MRLSGLKKYFGIAEVKRFSSVSAAGKYVTKLMMKKYKLTHPDYINCGYCFIWAYLVSVVCTKPVEFMTNSNHVVVTDGTLFYDSENPDGTSFEEIFEGYSSDPGIVKADRTLMSFFWMHVGLKKCVFKKIIKVVDPTGIIARTVLKKKNEEYYSSDELCGCGPEDCLVDLTKLEAIGS